MAHESGNHRIYFSEEKMLEGTTNRTFLHWRDTYELTKRHAVLRAEDNCGIHFYRSIIVSMPITINTGKKILKDKLTFFVGKEARYGKKLSEMYDEIYLKGGPQEILGIESFDEFIGLDESLTEELERALGKLRDPLLIKIAADSVSLPILGEQNNVYDVLPLKIMYNSSCQFVDRYVSGGIN